MFYLLEGLIFTILAADFGAIQGRWCKELGLPFAGIAESGWIAVPILFFVVAFPRIRKMLGYWHHLVHLVAFGCVSLPLLIFFSQTSEIRLSERPKSNASREIRERFPNKILVVGGSDGTRVYFPDTLDEDEMAEVIFTLDPSIRSFQTSRKSEPDK